MNISLAKIEISRAAKIVIAALFLAIVAAPIIISQRADAATLTQVLVRFDRMTVSTATTGTVCAKPATAGTEADVRVTFPSGYSLGAFGTFTVDTATQSGWPSGANAWISINTATNVTGQVVTFPSGDLVVGTLYCFNWTNTAAVTTDSSTGTALGGSVETRASGPTQIDIGTFSTALVASGQDQITVTATVPQSFSFSLSAFTDALGTLSTGSVSTSPTPRVATVNTNAKNGWLVWAKSAATGPGLKSSSSSGTIPSNCAAGAGSNTTLAAGTAGYNTGIETTQSGGSGTITQNSVFSRASTNYKGGGLCTTYQTLASSNGTADTATVTLYNNAAISPITPAASDYTDTITVVAAGLF